MMEYNPLVSIVVPVYKVEKYIGRAVSSLLHQSYKNVEIVLVDDGSPDKCPSLCDEYAKQDSRIKVIHKLNGGLSDARNEGIKNCMGEFITFVDSDDYISEDCVAVMVGEALNNKADIVCCGANIIDSKGNIYDYRKSHSLQLMTGPDLVRRLFEDEFPYNYSWGKMFRREILEGILFPINRLYEDMATTYRMAAKARNVLCLPQCLYFYERGREGNITSELNSSKAAKSYYDGCLNSLERLSFCSQHEEYNDMRCLILRQLYIWAKLCVESSIGLGKTGYREYVNKLKDILRDVWTFLPKRLTLILTFSGLYYYVYPVIGRKS